MQNFMDKGVNNMKKYELTNETKKVNGKTFYRIKALKDFGNIKKGELGGYVESENILSQEGNCWIYSGATVDNGTMITEDTEIHPFCKNDEEKKCFNELADILRDMFDAPLDTPVSVKIGDDEDCIYKIER